MTTKRTLFAGLGLILAVLVTDVQAQGLLQRIRENRALVREVRVARFSSASCGNQSRSSMCGAAASQSCGAAASNCGYSAGSCGYSAGSCGMAVPSCGQSVNSCGSAVQSCGASQSCGAGTFSVLECSTVEPEKVQNLATVPDVRDYFVTLRKEDHADDSYRRKSTRIAQQYFIRNSSLDGIEQSAKTSIFAKVEKKSGSRRST